MRILQTVPTIAVCLLALTGQIECLGAEPQINTVQTAAQAEALIAPSGPTVFLFVSTECPISNKYAPEVRRLISRFGDKAQFRLVYPDGETTQADVEEHLRSFQYDCAAIRDPARRLAQLCGVRVTPEAAVFAAGKLVYLGRIDDRFPQLGVKRPEAGSRDLEQVLTRVVAGEKLTFTTTEAVGCYISGK